MPADGLPNAAFGPLLPGESLLWQGRPDGGAFLSLSQAGRLIRTTLMIVLFVYVLARVQKTIPPLWDVRMIVLFLFFQAVPSEVLLSVLRRRRTRYMLTSQRAVILTDQAIFGQKVLSLPITPATVLDLQVGRCLTTIAFPQGQRRGWRLFGPAPVPGFERLADGTAVLALIRTVQTASTPREAAR